MIKYYCPIFEFGYVYSVDMVRLSLEFKQGADLEKLCCELNSFDSMVQYIPSFKDFKYRHMYRFGYDGMSYVVGVSLNGVSKDDILKRGFIEFNPNKILGDICYADGFIRTHTSPFYDSEYVLDDLVRSEFSTVLHLLYSYCVSVTVKKWDFAIDVPLPRNEVQLCKDNRKYSQFFKSELDFTEYLGSGNGAGRVKVYNKQLESELDYDLTRIELTLDSFDYVDLLKRLPKVYIRNWLDFDKENVTVKLLRRLPTSELDFFLRQLDRKTKEKYKGVLLQKPFTIPESIFDKLITVAGEFEL